jgi:very-short-patch-repair endonuclease
MKVSCARCGKVVNKKPREVRERNYCSRTCYYASGAPRPSRRTGQDKTCEVCGEVFYALASRPDVRFCSLSCKGVASRRTFACEVCNAESYGFQNLNKRWCSRECASRARRDGEDRDCLRCSKTFYAPRSRIELGQAMFCSQACHNEHQGRNKTSHTCKVCSGSFRWSPSRTAGGKYNVTYCSLACRDADPDVRARLLIMNTMQATLSPNGLERAGYALLDELGVAYTRQTPFMGEFTPDALLPDHRLVVQFDGDYWHDRAGTSTEPRILQHVARDRRQDEIIRSYGWQVVRLWESDLLRNPEACAAEIRRHLCPSA